MKNTIKTAMGTAVELNKMAYANHLTELTEKGYPRPYGVKLTGETFEYEEFKQKFIEFEAVDWDGSLIRISEKDIYQY